MNYEVIADLMQQLEAERERSKILLELIADVVEDENIFETEWNIAARKMLQAAQESE